MDAYGSGTYSSELFGVSVAINNGLNNPVFPIKDGTDSPILTPGWTIQGVQLYTRATNYVFNDRTRTPVNVAGWTVQNSATGSDQNLVQGGI